MSDVDSLASWGPAESVSDSSWGPGVAATGGQLEAAGGQAGYTCAGTLSVFLVLATEGTQGLWHEWEPEGPLVGVPPSELFAIGAVLGRWQLMTEVDCNRLYDADLSAEMSS